MSVDADTRLIAALADGLAIVARPFAVLGAAAGMTEDEAMERLQRLADDGVIKRFGLVVRHHELGYRANAMVVWDVAEFEVAGFGRRLAGRPEVTLCYRRERRPSWTYNLYVMIHGRDRSGVLAALARLEAETGLASHPRQLLFSRRRFKQTGARYGTTA